MSGNRSGKNRIMMYAGMTVACLAVLTIVLLLAVRKIGDSKENKDLDRGREIMEDYSEHLANVTRGPFDENAASHNNEGEATQTPLLTSTPTPTWTPTPRPIEERQTMLDLRTYYGNDEIMGYLNIPGTEGEELQPVSYPVLQATDNDFYMDRGVRKEVSKRGSLFLDYRSVVGVGYKGDNYVGGIKPSNILMIYGHNMQNETMFGSLYKYLDINYAQKCSIIEFDTLYEHRVYEIVSIFRSHVFNRGQTMVFSDPHDKNFKYYQFTDYLSEEEFEYWYANVVSHNEVKLLEYNAKYGDEFLVLSTCSSKDEFDHWNDSGRLCIVAVRIDH